MIITPIYNNRIANTLYEQHDGISENNFRSNFHLFKPLVPNDTRPEKDESRISFIGDLKNTVL